METIPIHKAKSTLSQLVKRAAAGETIYIGGYGRAQAKLIPAKNTSRILAAYGCMKDVPFPEGLNDPLPPEVIESFYDTRGLEDWAAEPPEQK